MSNLSLRVNVYVGSDIEQTCIEAVRLATFLNISIWFDFNEVECLARPNDNVDKLIQSYQEELTKIKGPYKIASAK